MKMDIFSFSRLNLYQTCPKRFYYKYVLDKDEPVTKPLALGKAVHKTVEDMIKGSDLNSAVQQGLVEADFHPEVKEEEIREIVKKAPIHKGIGRTEEYFCLPLSDSPSAPYLQGYIDLVEENEQGVTITDWKTNWKPYDIQTNHQIALYAWGIQKKRDVDKVCGKLSFLRFGRESVHVFDKEDMEQARKWALKLANEINSKLTILEIMPEKVDELFPDEPSSACSHCPFVLECFRNFSQYKNY